MGYAATRIAGYAATQMRGYANQNGRARAGMQGYMATRKRMGQIDLTALLASAGSDVLDDVAAASSSNGQQMTAMPSTGSMPLSTGAKVGIAVGGIAVVGLIAWAMTRRPKANPPRRYYFKRGRKNPRYRARSHSHRGRR